MKANFIGELQYKLSNNLNKLQKNIKQWKHYKIISCPSCQQKLRLPRKQGNIVVTCPKCSQEFKMRT